MKHGAGSILRRLVTMARNKFFNVHDLYPADYCFDYESFYADPEGYVFTPDDIYAINTYRKTKSRFAYNG